MLKKTRFNDPNKPLVSIIIYNYNYGRFLRECFESVVTQTYDNIEINFSDNASEDNSWEIALEYARKYPGIITIARNRKNLGSDANVANARINARGKYKVYLCSDDALLPEFVEQCVTALEAHPEAGYALVHRAIIDADGVRTEEPPFYNQSCIIPGPEQAAVYMMAAVNPSISQVLYNINMTIGKNAPSAASRWYANRIMDFHMCLEHSMIYIKEPLMLHRLHSQNESFRAAGNMMEIIAPYILQHQFAEAGEIYNIKKVVERLPLALEKLGNLCLRYCARALSEKDEKNALRYFHLAPVITPDIINNPVFVKINEYWAADDLQKQKLLSSFKFEDNLITRSVSYDPPEGSIPLQLKKISAPEEGVSKES